ERLFRQSANLCVIEDQHICASERILPFSRMRHICLDHSDIGMKRPQRAGIARMLVDADKFGIAAGLQTRNQILSDEPRCAGDDDLHSSTPSLKVWSCGKCWLARREPQT